MAALVLVGLAASFVGCKKENEKIDESTSTSMKKIESEFVFHDFDWVCKVKKATTISYLPDEGPNGELATLISDGTHNLEWIVTGVSESSFDEMKLYPLSDGWRFPTREDLDLAYGLIYPKSLCPTIGFIRKIGVRVLKTGVNPLPGRNPDSDYEWVFNGQGFFWMESAAGNNCRLGVRRSDKTTGWTECNRWPLAAIVLVRTY